MKKFLVLTLFVAAALTLAAPTMAQSATQTASTTVNVNMPSFLVLYYRSSVTFDVSEAQLATLVGHGSNTVDEGALTGLTGFTDDAAVTGAGFTEPSSLTGTVSNFWGVRSVANAGENTTVTVAITTGSISNGTDNIVISNPQTRQSGGAFAGTSTTFSPTGLGAGSLQLGDVQFDVDLSAVSTSGAYTGGVVEVTAQNI